LFVVKNTIGSITSDRTALRAAIAEAETVRACNTLFVAAQQASPKQSLDAATGSQIETVLSLHGGGTNRERTWQSLTAEAVSELGVSNLYTDLFIYCYEVF
jgi:hypothetical protein